MFGRRRHVAAAAAPSVAVIPSAASHPRLAEEQIFELVHARIAAAIGEGGEWVVRRRTTDDTDELFRAVLAHQVAVDVTAALRVAQLQLESGGTVSVAAPVSVAPVESRTRSVASAERVAAVDPDERLATVDELRELGLERAEAARRASVADGLTDVTPVRAEVDDLGPAHRDDESNVDEDAVLDEAAIALQWEPAPITVWTDLKKPVTGPIPAQRVSRDLVA